jgi:hypothetical protein
MGDRAHTRQVFGLADASALVDRLSTRRRFPVSRPVRTYGFRFCLPLRDSPGFSPGSLFTLRARSAAERPTARRRIHHAPPVTQGQPACFDTLSATRSRRLRAGDTSVRRAKGPRCQIGPLRSSRPTKQTCASAQTVLAALGDERGPHRARQAEQAAVGGVADFRRRARRCALPPFSPAARTATSPSTF